MADPRRDVTRRRDGQSLVDVLDRILDKGLVLAGDIQVSLADVELLTIRIRLVLCSIDKAREVGLDWWRTDPSFSTAARLDDEGETDDEGRPRRRRLASRVNDLEEKIDRLLDGLDDRVDTDPGGGPETGA